MEPMRDVLQRELHIRPYGIWSITRSRGIREIGIQCAIHTVFYWAVSVIVWHCRPHQVHQRAIK